MEDVATEESSSVAATKQERERKNAKHNTKQEGEKYSTIVRLTNIIYSVNTIYCNNDK